MGRRPAGPLGRWENLTIPEYLDAMAAWLESYEQAFISTGRPVPADGWTIFASAVRAAAINEQQLPDALCRGGIRPAA